MKKASAAASKKTSVLSEDPERTHLDSLKAEFENIRVLLRDESSYGRRQQLHARMSAIAFEFHSIIERSRRALNQAFTRNS